MQKYRMDQVVGVAGRRGISRRAPAVLLSWLTICFAFGCESQVTDEGLSPLAENSPSGTTAALYHPSVANNAPSKIAIPFEYDDLEPAYPPAVFLSDQHAAICLAKVGDSFPDFSLPDISGETQTLSPLLGTKGTVVIVWNTDFLFALEQFERHPKDLGACYDDPNLSVITIAVGEETSRVQELAAEFGIDGSVLIDSDSVLYRQIATERLPHSYVLDATGEIVWHDLEYSRTTRREMLNAVRFVLTHP